MHTDNYYTFLHTAPQPVASYLTVSSISLLPPHLFLTFSLNSKPMTKNSLDCKANMISAQAQLCKRTVSAERLDRCNQRHSGGRSYKLQGLSNVMLSLNKDLCAATLATNQHSFTIYMNKKVLKCKYVLC